MRPRQPSRLLARLSAVLVLLAGLGGWFILSTSVALPATAAPCPKPLPAAAMARADAVFTGQITAAAAGAKGAFTNTVTVTRIYKGSVPAASVQVQTTGGTCGLGALKVGQAYVLMVTVAGDQLVAAGNSGTAPASAGLLTRVTGVLGEGTAYGAVAEPVEVQFTQVGDSSPTPLMRAAAPGLALALAGLLGWLFVRRFA